MKAGLSLEALARELSRQNEAKQDYLLEASQLETEAFGRNVFLHLNDRDGNDSIEPLEIGAIAHRQFGTYLGIPSKYYDKMLTEAPNLLTTNLNHWFAEKTDIRMVRTLDGVARAFLSNRYRCIDNFEVASAVLPIIGEMPDARFESCQITESRMYIKVVNPRLQAEVSPGDVVQAGIVITNSEVGMSSFSVQPLIYRLVCSNGMVRPDSGLRRIHTGRINTADENYLLYRPATLAADDRAFLLKVQDTVRAAVDEVAFHQVLDVMREAKNARINTADVPGVVKLTAREFALTEEEGNGVLQYLIEGNDLSCYGLANAVTRHSQDIENYDRASDLEVIGYNVMSMTRAQWNRLNQAA